MPALHPSPTLPPSLPCFLSSISLHPSAVLRLSALLSYILPSDGERKRKTHPGWIAAFPIPRVQPGNQGVKHTNMACLPSLLSVSPPLSLSQCVCVSLLTAATRFLSLWFLLLPSSSSSSVLLLSQTCYCRLFPSLSPSLSSSPNHPPPFTCSDALSGHNISGGRMLERLRFCILLPVRLYISILCFHWIQVTRLGIYFSGSETYRANNITYSCLAAAHQKIFLK